MRTNTLKLGAIYSSTAVVCLTAGMFSAYGVDKARSGLEPVNLTTESSYLEYTTPTVEPEIEMVPKGLLPYTVSSRGDHVTFSYPENWQVSTLEKMDFTTSDADFVAGFTSANGETVIVEAEKRGISEVAGVKDSYPFSTQSGARVSVFATDQSASLNTEINQNTTKKTYEGRTYYLSVNTHAGSELSSEQVNYILSSFSVE